MVTMVCLVKPPKYSDSETAGG